MKYLCMKRTKHRTKTFFLCIFLLSGLSQLTSCNIITNGGFEESFLSANEELQTSPTAAQDSQIREISFSEYEWIVRNSYGNAQGPGPNFFNNSEENVWVDNAGALHLKIREYNGTWYCSEVYSKETFGYGTYVFKVGDEFQNIDKNIIVGLFTYLN